MAHELYGADDRDGDAGPDGEPPRLDEREVHG